MSPISLLRKTCCECLLILSLAPPAFPQTSKPRPELPRVVLIGDSIRLGYAPLVAERLKGRAVVISAAANGGDSNNVLEHLDEWVVREKPDVVHFNCGIHDLKVSREGKQPHVEFTQYEAKRDADVPAAYRNLDVGAFTVPKRAEAWRQERSGVYQSVVQSLGELPPRPAPPRVRTVSRELRRGYTLERVAIDNGLGNDISALHNPYAYGYFDHVPYATNAHLSFVAIDHLITQVSWIRYEPAQTK